MKNVRIKRAFRLPVIISLGVLTLFLVVQAFLPIEKVRVGECGGVTPTRLSLLFGGSEKIEEAKKDATELRENRRKSELENGDLALGCVTGPHYELYLIL